MTEYLTNYMKYITEKLASCGDMETLDDIMREHKDKIAFMQHERIVHFFVTMLVGLCLAIFMSALLFTENIGILILVTIFIVLLAFYLKHYYFLENTVQKMYRVYDEILAKERSFRRGEQ